MVTTTDGSSTPLQFVTDGNDTAKKMVLDDQQKAEDSSSLKTKIWDLWLTFCCVEPEDDFVQVLRKSSSALLFLMGFGPFGFGVFFVIRWLQGESEFNDDSGGLSSKILTVDLLLWGCWDWFPHVWIRATRHMSTAVADTLLFGLEFFTMLSSLVWPDSCVNVACIAAALLAVLTQTRFVVFHCVALSFVFCLDSFNKSYRHTSNEVLLPGARDSLLLESYIVFVGGGVVVGLGILGVSAQSIAHIKHVSAAKAAVNVCHQIVNLLRRYDTEGVTKALAEHKDVDPELILSLKTINSNLESYRPFLPNYLFQDEDDDEEEDRRHAKDLPSDDEGSLSNSQSATGASASDHGGSSTTLSISSRTSHIEDRELSGNGGGAPTRKLSKTLLHGNDASNSQAQRPQVFEGSISFALVETPTHLHGSSDASLASQFVESVYAAADVSKASVHTLTGGVAVISWNATHRVPQPEMKATRFLNLLKNSQVGTGLKFGAVVFSGAASCYSVTTSGKKQHACVIAAPWMPMATEAFSLACRHKVMLIDQKTEAVSSSNFESMFVDRVALCDKVDDTFPVFETEILSQSVIFLTPLALSRATRPHQHQQSALHLQRITSLFQLVREVDLNDEEWMYQLEMKEQSENHGKRLEEAALDVFELIVKDITDDKNDSPTSFLSDLQAAATAVCGVIHELNEKTLAAAVGDAEYNKEQAAAAMVRSSLMLRLERHMKSISLP